MKASCNIVIEFDSKNKAEHVLKSVEVDNLDFVKTKIKDKRIEAKIESNSVSSLLHTLDDYLACVSVAEKVTR
jgi:tRNA threonylcarbamoyladenosine modification (KEOPS) complex  Pcc1 subunit